MARPTTVSTVSAARPLPQLLQPGLGVVLVQDGVPVQQRVCSRLPGDLGAGARVDLVHVRGEVRQWGDKEGSRRARGG